MNLITAITRIKAAVHDYSEEFPREACIGFLNTTIQQAAAMLVAGGYPELLKEVVLHNGDYLPKNIMRACGTYPIKTTNGQAEFLDEDETEIAYRYFATPDNIPADATDNYELPFTNDAINEAIVRQATVMALNQNEFDTRQDTAQMAEFQQAIIAAMNGE